MQHKPGMLRVGALGRQHVLASLDATIGGAAFAKVIGPGVFRSQGDARSVIEPWPATLRLLAWHLQPFKFPYALHPFVVHTPPGDSHSGHIA